MKFPDKDGGEFEVEGKRNIQFAQDMVKAGIPIRSYSGRFMYGAVCPAVSVQRDSDYALEDVIRATKLKGLRQDSLGLGLVVYP